MLKINPTTAPPTVAKSGSVIVSISTNVQKIIIDAKTIPPIAWCTGSNSHKARKINAVSVSTKGYLNDIGRLQQRALPRKRIQPMIGRLSYHFMSLPHAQCEGGETMDSPLGSLKMQTFKKLPMHAPMQKKNTSIIIGNCAIVSLMSIEMFFECV